MARKLQIKRGLKENLPQLSEGEFGLTTDEKKVYIGTGDGNVSLASLDENGKIPEAQIPPTTKESIGLENVDNTSDTNKPISSATQTALNLKLDKTNYTASDILTKLKTVDGEGSGLDADLLDGMNATSENTPNTIVSRDSNGLISTTKIVGSLQGNADTSTKLLTARTINGVSFDGTANITIADNTKAPLNSPVLTGTPTAPTPPSGDNTKQIATTEFVQNTVTAIGAGDMNKSTYDTNNNGIVDNAEKLDGRESAFYANVQSSASMPTNQRVNDIWLEIIQ